tara:strand:- start:296 stop:949 length:654 start_codon:yes stop_codon:yes gene_type:complete
MDKLFRLISPEKKLSFFLDLSWIFEWLSLEYSLKVYKEKEHPRLKTLKPFLKKHINSDSTVVDYGCSTGTMSNFYADFCKNVIAIDFIKEDILEAKRLYDRENIDFVCADAYAYLDSNQLKYDVLIFAHVVGYFENPYEVFMKFKPFFKHIFIEVPDFDSMYSNHYRKSENRDLIFMDNNYVHEFNRDEILEEVEKAGLKVIDTEFRYGQIRIWCEC